VAEEEPSVREVGGGDLTGRDENMLACGWADWMIDGRLGWLNDRRTDDLAVAAAEDERYNRSMPTVRRVAGSQALVRGPGCGGGEDCERIDEWVPDEHRDAEGRTRTRQGRVQ
jgi:hypothetical protein